MYESRPKRKMKVALLLGVLLLVGVVAVAIAVYRNGAIDERSLSATELRIITQQRREAIIEVVSAINVHLRENSDRLPTPNEVSGVIQENLDTMPIDPFTGKEFVIQMEEPKTLYAIQYAPMSACTDNLYALKPGSSSSDFALLVQDRLTEYFCLSNNIITGDSR